MGVDLTPGHLFRGTNNRRQEPCTTNQEPSTANQEPVLTYVSPLPLEGRDRYHSLMLIFDPLFLEIPRPGLIFGLAMTVVLLGLSLQEREEIRKREERPRELVMRDSVSTIRSRKRILAKTNNS